MRNSSSNRFSSFREAAGSLFEVRGHLLLLDPLSKLVLVGAVDEGNPHSALPGVLVVVLVFAPLRLDREQQQVAGLPFQLLAIHLRVPFAFDHVDDDATLVPVLLLFNKAFRYFSMGYASALAWILFSIILVFTLFQLKMAPKWVHYEAEKGK